MKVYVSVDMEGVAGVVHVDQTRRGGHDYDRARRWMTAEGNAAIAAAFDAGAEWVLVNDSHGDMRNLAIDELDPRVELISCSLKPLSMVQGASRDFDVALFVGYHAGAGSRAGMHLLRQGGRGRQRRRALVQRDGDQRRALRLVRRARGAGDR